MLVKIQNKDLGGECFFRSSWEKKVYENNKRTDIQETTADGLPIWSVKAELVQGGSVEEIIVSVPMKRNPAEGLQLNEKIAFVGMTIESGSRRSGGRWERISADSIVRAKRGE